MRAMWVLPLVAACGFSGGSDGPTDATDATPDVPIFITDAPNDARPEWWHASWRSRRLITIDNSKLTGTVTGFPILIKLTPATLNYSAVAPNGADLRFVTEDNLTVLPHELDSYIANSDTFVWVRMPSMMPNGASPKIWLYYSNPTATGTSDGAAVFADTHVSVHHLGPNGFPDATGHGYAGTAASNATPSETAGMIARARGFDGVNDLIALPETPYDFTNTMSASAWVRVTAFNVEFQTILAKGNSAWRVHRDNTSNVAGFGTTTATLNDNVVGSTNLNNGAWHHVAIVFEITNKRLYVDGAPDGSSIIAGIDTNNVAVTIGANLDSGLGGTRNWNGQIDEVRISASPRTAAWIAAEHTTVADPAFVAIGPEERY